MFTFYFNLKVNPDGKEVTYSLNKTCSPSVPWSAREVTCMMNYMEVHTVGYILVQLECLLFL